MKNQWEHAPMYAIPYLVVLQTFPKCMHKKAINKLTRKITFIIVWERSTNEFITCYFILVFRRTNDTVRTVRTRSMCTRSANWCSLLTSRRRSTSLVQTELNVTQSNNTTDRLKMLSRLKWCTFPNPSEPVHVNIHKWDTPTSNPYVHNQFGENFQNVNRSDVSPAQSKDSM